MKSSKAIVEPYLTGEDWRVKENSNSPFCYGGLNRYICGEVSKDYWLRNIYPEEIAQGYVTGHMHIHDLSGLTLYCSGYSLRDILLKGVRGVPNIPTSAPAKHFDSALNQISNLLTVFQNEIMGAVALNSFDTLLAPFIKNDGLTFDQVKQNMQNFIFSINSNSRMGAEPAFTNLTFDLTPSEDLLNEYVIIGGELASFTYGSCQHEMDILNKVFFEVMLEGDSDHKLFAYPIPTYNIHKRFDWDNPNNKLLWELAGKFGTPYFANYINSDMNPEDARSMCPLSGKTKVIYYSERLKKWSTLSIKDLYCNNQRDGVNTIKTIANGKIVNCKINKFNVPADYVITLVNNAQIRTTADHLNKVYGKEYVKTKDLTTEDYLPYYTRPTIINNNMNYNQGKIIGMYLGDGSKQDEYSVTFSLNETTKSDLIDFLFDYCINEYNAKISICQCKSEISGKYSCTNVKVNSKIIRGLVEQFVKGDNALNKELDADFLNTSEEFRQGIIDGLYATDGGNSNRIYTSSKPMTESLELLFASMGMATNITEDNRDGRLGKNTCYTVRYYTPNNYHKGRKDIYINDDNYLWIKVKSVTYSHYNGASVSYCLEILDEDEPEEFMLANGIVTHNCRLRLDLTELRKRNGGLFGSGDSTGSIGVVTINLPRIAYENKGDKDKFYKELDYYLNLAKESLVIKREWLNKNIIETHAIPAFMEYVGSLKNYFSTIGIVGMNEMCENFLGKNIITKEGKVFAERVGNHIRNKLVEFQEETGVLYNFEATPAESTCYRLALKDKKDYPDIITQGNGKDVYYTNSCHIPVKMIEGINATFKHQETLQSQFTGGTVIHLYEEGAISGDNAKAIVKAMFTNYAVPYMSISPISRYCDEHGYVKELIDECPYCHKPLKKYQRITGYLRCVDNFNPGKRAEFNDRKQLTEAAV